MKKNFKFLMAVVLCFSLMCGMLTAFAAAEADTDLGSFSDVKYIPSLGIWAMVAGPNTNISNYIYTSTDGQNWVGRVTMGEHTTFKSFCYGAENGIITNASDYRAFVVDKYINSVSNIFNIVEYDADTTDSVMTDNDGGKFKFILLDTEMVWDPVTNKYYCGGIEAVRNGDISTYSNVGLYSCNGIVNQSNKYDGIYLSNLNYGRYFKWEKVNLGDADPYKGYAYSSATSSTLKGNVFGSLSTDGHGRIVASKLCSGKKIENGYDVNKSLMLLYDTQNSKSALICHKGGAFDATKIVPTTVDTTAYIFASRTALYTTGSATTNYHMAKYTFGTLIDKYTEMLSSADTTSGGGNNVVTKTNTGLYNGDATGSTIGTYISFASNAGSYHSPITSKSTDKYKVSYDQNGKSMAGPAKTILKASTSDPAIFIPEKGIATTDATENDIKYIVGARIAYNTLINNDTKIAEIFGNDGNANVLDADIDNSGNIVILTKNGAVYINRTSPAKYEFVDTKYGADTADKSANVSSPAKNVTGGATAIRFTKSSVNVFKGEPYQLTTNMTDVNWSVIGDVPEGLTFDAETGTVTVAEDSATSSFVLNVRAASKDYPSVFVERSVDITVVDYVSLIINGKSYAVDNTTGKNTEALTGLANGENSVSVKFNVPFENDADNVKAFIALFKDGQMLDAGSIQADVKAGDTFPSINETIVIPTGANLENYSIKIFLWDENLRPLRKNLLFVKNPQTPD